MCNRYDLKPSLEQIAERYGAELAVELDLQQEILPRSIAPGVLADGEGQRWLLPMQFAFSPPGCPAPSDPKRTLNNARIESVSKWPWKDAFRTQRCVVPISHFREPCYWGPTAGTEVYFHRPDDQPLHAAGIYRKWTSPDGQTEIITMALLMRPASHYVMQHGHHRQPLFVELDQLTAWLDPQPHPTESLLSLLRSMATTPELTHTHARAMAESWTKRRAAKLRDRDQQLQQLESLGPVGF